MKTNATIFLFIIAALCATEQTYSQVDTRLNVSFCGNLIRLKFDPSIDVKFDNSLSEQSIEGFYSILNKSNYQPLIRELINYKEQNNLNDWLYYQLISRTAQQISPKAENYYRYTLYKWFLLTKSGFGLNE